jgi:hypothetical protein
VYLPVHAGDSELLRAGTARTIGSILGKGKQISSLLKRLYRLRDPSRAPIRRVPQAVSLVIKQSGRAADHYRLEWILRMTEATLLLSEMSPRHVRVQLCSV